MKPFETYQRIPGTPETDRDKQEVGSNSWNEGKWDKFVAPFLSKDCDGMTFVDMGCNAGLYLKLAEERGFSNVIGVDNNWGAVERGTKYQEEIGGKYQIRLAEMENAIDSLPVADYTILVNSHYYFNVADWLKYLDKLKQKTVHCIIVTANKREVLSNAASDVDTIIRYFKDGGWEHAGRKDPEDRDYDKRDRTLWGLHFKSGLERVSIESLDNGNGQQRGFLKEMDEGKLYTDTEYYRRFYDYRVTKGEWSVEKLDEYFDDYVELIKDMEVNGQLEPIVVMRSNMRIVDGNHRHEIMRHKGLKSIIVRWV